MHFRTSVEIWLRSRRHFVCDFDARVLPIGFVVYSVYADQLARWVSDLVKLSLGARENLTHVDAACVVAVD